METDAGKGLLVLFLDGLSSEEDDQVAWKTEDSKWRMWRSGMVLRGVEEGEEGRRAIRK